jgi:hypothetical protein
LVFASCWVSNSRCLTQFADIAVVAEILGELVVHLGQFLAANALQRGVELDCLARQLFGPIVLGIDDVELALFARVDTAQVLGKSGEGVRSADFKHHFIGFHRVAVDTAEAFESHHGMVALFHRPGIHVDVLRLLFAEFLDAFVDVLFTHLRLGVGYFDAAVVAQFDFRDHFELRFEAQRLAVVEMDILDIGCADHVEVLGLKLLLEERGNQILQHLLPDITGELLANDAGGRFSRPEPGEFRAFLNVGRNAAQLAFYIGDWDGDFERVLATFD